MSANKTIGLDYNKPFPTKLRDLLEETKTTQAKLAAAVNIKRQTISNYSLGFALPNIETFEKIAEYFNVSAGYLLGKSEHKTIRNEEIGKGLGLSDKAIERLQGIPEIGGYDELFSEIRIFINKIIENDSIGLLSHYFLLLTDIDKEADLAALTKIERDEFTTAVHHLNYLIEQQNRPCRVIWEKDEFLRQRRSELLEVFERIVNGYIKW